MTIVAIGVKRNNFYILDDSTMITRVSIAS